MGKLLTVLLSFKVSQTRTNLFFSVLEQLSYVIFFYRLIQDESWRKADFGQKTFLSPVTTDCCHRVYVLAREPCNLAVEEQALF